MFTIGIDVGGTYTDLVALDERGKAVFAKSPSTPSDQSVGVMAGLDELARRLRLTRAEMLGVTDRVVHGTTVATNALLERKGADVALLTTEGHRDVVEMREGLKGDRYDLRSPPPEPLVPRERRFGVKERLKANGEILTPLDDRSLGDAIAACNLLPGPASTQLAIYCAWRVRGRRGALALAEPRVRRDAHDELVPITTEDGWDMSDRLARQEGLHIGHSSGPSQSVIFSALVCSRSYTQISGALPPRYRFQVRLS